MRLQSTYSIQIGLIITNTLYCRLQQEDKFQQQRVKEVTFHITITTYILRCSQAHFFYHRMSKLCTNGNFYWV